MKINVMGRAPQEIKKQIKNIASKTLSFMKQPNNLEMTVKIVSPKQIQELNKNLRNVDKVTDVLSFPSLNLLDGEIVVPSYLKESTFDGVNVYIGDCAICLEVAKKQAEEHGITYEMEIDKLICHSVLHLLGFDHVKSRDFERMHSFEVRILGDY